MTKRTEKTSKDLDNLLQFKCSYLASLIVFNVEEVVIFCYERSFFGI